MIDAILKELRVGKRVSVGEFSLYTGGSQRCLTYSGPHGHTFVHPFNGVNGAHAQWLRLVIQTMLLHPATFRKEGCLLFPYTGRL